MCDEVRREVSFVTKQFGKVKFLSPSLQSFTRKLQWVGTSCEGN